ncbi:MAG: hypothetical protein ACRCWD_04310, partial [Culicoidibacterales bacterium]
HDNLGTRIQEVDMTGLAKKKKRVNISVNIGAKLGKISWHAKGELTKWIVNHSLKYKMNNE